MVLINGIDRSDYVIMGSLSITDVIASKVNTCNFRTYDIDGTFVPDSSDTIEVYDNDSNKIFAGVIASTDQKRIGMNPGLGTELLGYSVACQDWTRLLQRRLVIETFQNQTCKEIMQAILDKYFPGEGFTLTNFADGPTIVQITFNYKYGTDCLNALAEAAGFDWFIDYDKDIHFFDQADLSSVETFTDSTDNWRNLAIKPDTSQLRNRIYVRGGIYYSSPYTQDILADGIQKEFLLAYTPNTEGFTILVDSVEYSVGIKNVDEAEDYDFLVDRKEKSISMGQTLWANANTPLAADSLIEATYSYEIPILVVQEDSDSIANMQSLEGGSGVYEYLIVDKNISSIQAARDRAAAELRDFANPITLGTLTSYDLAGIKSGDLITINSTRRGVNADYLVQQVKITQKTSGIFQYDIDFSGKLYGFVDILISLFKRTTDIVLGLDEVLDAFNFFRDSITMSHNTPTATLGAPPYKWSNSAGTTPNKMRWNLFQWS